MTEVLRLYDADRSALAARVQAARTALGAADGGAATAVTVSTYTYWYTSRPPVHEAILLRPDGP